MQRQSALLAALQALSEKELTELVLIPLFGAIGYERVEYAGGSTEEGKDLICWRRDELGEIELAVVQVKRYRLTRPASSSRSLQTIMNQLSQASEKALPNSETAQRHEPNVIYLVSPYALETQVLHSKFEALPGLRRCRIKIIDGVKLGRLIDTRMRPIANRLLGRQGLYADVQTAQLTNKVLLRALDVFDAKPVAEFYTDTDLALGQLTGRLLFSAAFSPKQDYVSIKLERWNELVEARNRVKDVYGADVFVDSFESLQAAAEAAGRLHKTWSDEREKQADLFNKRSAVVAEQKRRFEQAVGELEPSIQVGSGVLTARTAIRELLNEFRTLRTACGSPKAGREEKAGYRRRMKEVEVRLAGRARDLARLVDDLYDAELALEECRLAINAVDRERPKTELSIGIDGRTLVSQILAVRKRLTGEVAALGMGDAVRLRELLVRCHADLTMMRAIAGVPELLAVLAPDLDNKKSSDDTRLTVGVQAILDTHVNLLLLGEAGAGKTTSLQMYAHRNLQAAFDAGIVLYVPMSRLPRLLRQERGLDLEQTIDDVSLLDLLVSFVGSLGLVASASDLVNDLEKGGAVLLDGVDEILGDLPNLFIQLDHLASRFPMVQWVASARSSGQLGFETSLVAVTLLPFSQSQKIEFVTKWFGPGQRGAAESVLQHLSENDQVNAVVSNPLLLTILCVLAEHRIPLPSSEVRLYRERFELLLGRYDIHKDVRRLTTRSEHLMLLAQKLAFRLHSLRRREAKLQTLRDLAVEYLGDELGAEAAVNALHELIEPANVLVPVSLDGRYGFGHLRFQEYLCARECENRSVDIFALLEREEWADVLILFSMSSAGLAWLVERARALYLKNSLPPIISRMVQCGPARERAGLLWLLENWR